MTSSHDGDGQTDVVQRARTRAVVYAVLSVAVAGATALAAGWVVAGYESRLGISGPLADDGSQVLLAAHELRPGHILGEEDVVLGAPPVGVDVDSLYTTPGRILGKTVGDRILAGEAVRPERLTSGGAELRVNEVLDPGSRAVTIRTSHAASVGGLLKPGFFVDVIVTMRPETKDLAAEWATETILQGVRVVAVNDSVSSNPGLVDDAAPHKGAPARATFVTLEVEPPEAEELALATLRGEIVLSLRARDDFRMLDPGGPLVTNALMGILPPIAEAQEHRLARKREVAARIEPERTAIEVSRGRRTTVEEFDPEGRHIETRR